MPRVREHQGHHFLGHSVGIGAGRVHHIDLFFAGVLGVDRVVAGPGPDNDFQRGKQVDDFLGHLFAANNHRVGVGILFGQRDDIGGIVLDHKVMAVGLEKILGHAIELRRNQHFFLHHVLLKWGPQ